MKKMLPILGTTVLVRSKLCTSAVGEVQFSLGLDLRLHCEY